MEQRNFDSHLAVRASRLHFLDGVSKVDIAQKLDLSRFKVARLIDEAVERGLVRIEVLDPGGVEDELATNLTAQFGLNDAIVVPNSPATSDTLTELGGATARYLAERLHPGDVLGLGWGSSVGAVVDALPRANHPGPVDAVQLAGGFPSAEPSFNGAEVTLAAAHAMHGRSHLLHAPALMESAEARDVLHAEPTVTATINTYEQVTMTLTGIGALRPSPVSAIYRGNILGNSAVQLLTRAGAVGDACCHFIDANGTVIPELADRTSGIGVEQVRNIPLRIGVVTGRAKLLAIAAALRSKLITVLATDQDTANALLTMQEES